MNEMILGVGEVMTLYDPQTAAAIVSFKTSSSPSRGTAVVKTKHGIGGLILSASDEKPILSVFSFQKVCSGLKHVVSEIFETNIG
jgi:pre-rRNA-processing protein IPI3